MQRVCQVKREITPEILVILCTYISGGLGWQLAAFSVASVCITQAPITLPDGNFGIGQLSCSLDRRYRLFHNSRLPSYLRQNPTWSLCLRRCSGDNATYQKHLSTLLTLLQLTLEHSRLFWLGLHCF